MTNKITKGNSFLRIADLSLAGFLFLNCPLEDIERPKDERKSFFIFKKSTKTDELVNRFWQGKARIEPQAYFNALRIIKARLYGEE